MVEVCHDIPDGTIKVSDQGNALYWLCGDTTGKGEKISAEEWKAYCKKMPNFLLFRINSKHYEERSDRRNRHFPSSQTADLPLRLVKTADIVFFP